MKINILGKLVRNLELYRCWRKGNGNKPLAVDLLITSKCNSRCVMCNIWKLPKEKPEDVNNELSTQEWMNLLKELSEMGTKTLYISGGEPLMRDDIPEIIRYAKREVHFEFVEVDTNGILMTETTAEDLVASDLDVIHFSIDGPTAEIHDKIRGVKGSWERAVDGINFINRAKKKLNSEKPSIAIGYVISGMNYQYIDQMIDLKSELGYDMIQLMRVLAKMPQMQQLLLTDEYLKNLENSLGVLETKFRNAGLPISALSPVIMMCRDKESAKEGGYAKAINSKVLCFNPWEHAVVDSFGDVYPCYSACPLYNLSPDLDILWEADEYVLGNIKNNSFSEIWNCDKYNQFRNRLRQDFPSLPFCAWCCRRSVKDAILTGLFKDRALLFKIIQSKVRQRFRKSGRFEWEFLFK